MSQRLVVLVESPQRFRDPTMCPAQGLTVRHALGDFQAAPIEPDGLSRSATGELQAAQLVQRGRLPAFDAFSVDEQQRCLEATAGTAVITEDHLHHTEADERR